MPEQRRPDVLENAVTAKVKIAPPSPEGEMDLGAEIQDDLAEVDLPGEPDPQLAFALGKMNHQDLGVAYLNMGMVDEAIDEFAKAKPGKKKAAQVKAKAKVEAPKKAKELPKKAKELKNAEPAKAAKKAKKTKPVKAKKPVRKLAAKATKAKAKAKPKKKKPVAKKAVRKAAKTSKKPAKKKSARSGKRR